MLRVVRKGFTVLSLLFMTACDHHPWNNPYPESEATANIRYTSFFAPPKTLDPARSFSADEAIFTYQIYEPPLQYHFLKRPYTLIPLTAAQMPLVRYLDATGKPLAHGVPANQKAFTEYTITISPGIYYQPHPAFVKKKNGQYAYLNLDEADCRSIHRLSDFTQVASRELVADDYVYEIKRLAEPGINSPIYGIMATKIVGLSDFFHRLSKKTYERGRWVDLRQYPLSGVKLVDRYHYKIYIKGIYPQFPYWLAMPFFAPIPWEADAFYSQPLLIKHNITFDWYPIGTGPYALIENNPNRKMVLSRNPLYHPQYYPQEGEPGDQEAGRLKDAGKRLPFIDKAVFTLEKESIPRWNKFLQDYYDQSTISSDSFDQAVQIDSTGRPYLTPELKNKGVYLQTNFTLTISYIGFNMLDAVVGGQSERARKLRLAISIALDYQDYINIFLNGRGRLAQGPLPPGIFGYEESKATQKPLKMAKQLMLEAGYPNGIDPSTGEPLILNYDLATTSGPDEKAVLGWMRQQFQKIGIALNIRNTDFNRFQEKMRTGENQIFTWGWIADYPDPENFLFLLYGPNSKVRFGGENASNYSNPVFDQLFDQMKNMQNTRQRQQIIHKMLDIVRHDAPWICGIYQEDFILNHIWDSPTKPNALIYNNLKYQRLDPILRDKLRTKWNRRILWPLILVGLVLLVISFPVVVRYYQKERRSIKN